MTQSNSSPIANRSSLVFDHEGMMARLMDDDDLAQQVVATWLDDFPQQIAALKGYLETGNASGAERQAHSIKGASAIVGGERLRDVAFEMEKSAKAGDLDAVKTRMDGLEAQFDALKLAIESWEKTTGAKRHDN